MAMRSAVPGRMPPAPSGRDAGRVLRVLALIAVAIGLAALTAAACVLSYSSIHHLATLASVSPRLAQLYPLIFDALLVVAGCCVLALRGAGLVSRVYSWLCLLALLGALAAGGAVRAAAVRVPHRLAGILGAVIPWALVLMGFGLLLALLRYARIRRLGQRPDRAESDPAADPAELVVIENMAAPPAAAVGPAAAAGPAAAVGPAAIVPGSARTPGPGAPGVLPSATRTGGSLESPTAPQARRVGAGPAEAPPAEAPPAEGAPVQPAPVQPTPVQPGQVQPGPVQAGPVQPGQRAHAVVRQADLQLRARVPRQPAGQQEQANPVTARHAPFMPPVGPMPTAEAAAPGDAADSDTDTDTDVGTAAPATAAGSAQPTNPRRSPAPPAGGGETPRNEAAASTAQPNAAQPNAAEASPGAAEPEPGPGTGVPSADAPVTTTGLSAAPVTGDEPGEPPALRRPRSSPTPPED